MFTGMFQRQPARSPRPAGSASASGVARIRSNPSPGRIRSPPPSPSHLQGADTAMPLAELAGHKRPHPDSAPDPPPVPPASSAISNADISAIVAAVRESTQLQFQSFTEDTQLQFQSFTEEIRGFLHAYGADLQDARNRVALLEAAQADAAKAVDQRQASHDADISALRADLEALRASRDLQEADIEDLRVSAEAADRRARATSLIIHSVPEPETEQACALLTHGGTMADAGLLAFDRIGAPRDAPAARPRPILAKFVSRAARAAAFKRKSALRERGFVLGEDLTPAQRAVKARRAGEVAALMAEGFTVSWRGTALFKQRGEGQARQLVPPPPSHLPPPGGRTSRAANRERAPPAASGGRSPPSFPRRAPPAASGGAPAVHASGGGGLPAAAAAAATPSQPPASRARALDSCARPPSVLPIPSASPRAA